MASRYRQPGWKKLSAARIRIGRANDEPCCRCHGRLGPIRYDLDGRARLGPTTDHLIAIAHGGSLLVPMDQLGVAHRTCNVGHGSILGNVSQGLGPGSRGGNPATYSPRPARKPTQTSTIPAPTAPALQEATPTEPEDPELGPGPEDFADVPWLADLILNMPEDARWPRLMTAPHPRAVGSYGVDSIERIEARRLDDPRVPAREKALRWFQCLVLLRQWEHDTDGELCWPESLLSVRRQMGKSVLMSERSMDRVRSFASIADEPQLVMQISKDLASAREVQRVIRLWAVDCEDARKAQAREDNPKGVLPPGYKPAYLVRGTHGQEEIELADGGRYMIRGRDSVYSYSVSAAEVDEAWGIHPSIVDDGLSPTMESRSLAQLCLTSTAHPKTTPLFPARRAEAIRDLWAPGETTPLILEWSAYRGWDFSNPETWASASPVWDDRRRRGTARAHARWQSGQETAETAEAGGFPAQTLNVWPRMFRSGRKPWVTPEAWVACASPGLTIPRDRSVIGIALGDAGVAWWVVAAGQVDDGVGVRLIGVYPDRERAVHAGEQARGQACALVTPRGLRGHIALSGVRETVQAHEGDVTAALDLCQSLVATNRIHYDPDDQVLAEAVIALPERRLPGRWDPAVLAMVSAWWAGRIRPKSSAA